MNGKVDLMLRVALLLTSFAAIAASGPAMANCAEDVEETRGRLASLEKEAAAGAPHESWFGEPSAAEDVKALLDGAKDLAQNGKEEACERQLTQAKAVLGSLESKRDEQKAQRDEKTDEIRKEMKSTSGPGAAK
jgi:hypothetical protein